uniref:Uncharacterized protein n=1 Tax=Siphoviridae sp. ctTnV63 TaxID=2825523 RepID=A0A8S5NV04_9CAUD|nr:MAG TPA: hypothetical protein [Siphoviridae sp. ctTnV63]
MNVFQRKWSISHNLPRCTFCLQNSTFCRLFSFSLKPGLIPHYDNFCPFLSRGACSTCPLATDAPSGSRQNSTF